MLKGPFVPIYVKSEPSRSFKNLFSPYNGHIIWTNVKMLYVLAAIMSQVHFPSHWFLGSVHTGACCW